MTRRYVPQVEAVAPTGPLRVAGWCNGGLAALELVGLLESRGRTVERIVLIDTLSINARRLMRRIVHMVSLVDPFIPGALGRKLRRSGMPTVWRLAKYVLNGDRATLRIATKAARNGSNWLWDTSTRSTYHRAMSKYLPPKIRAAVTCLVCDASAGKKEYDTLAWKNLARYVQSDCIPGQHATCITIHVDVLAQRLNEVFAEQPVGQDVRVK